MSSTNQPQRHIEIERKYILSRVPDVPSDAQRILVDQGYYANEAGEAVRIRRMEDESTGRVWFRRSTKRVLTSLLVREETDQLIDEGEFEREWARTQGWRLRKRRYRWRDESAGVVWEIDEFLERDLVIAEVELEREEDRPPFPDWLAPMVEREVSGDPAFLNTSLARA